MNEKNNIIMLGAPVESGSAHRGCVMGPAALRTAGISFVLEELGYSVEDMGDATPDSADDLVGKSIGKILCLEETAGWVRRLKLLAKEMMYRTGVPVFLGGDHSLSLGTVTGVAEYASETKRPLFVLWLDAHPDFNTFESTESGNTHGMPVAYFCGLNGFDALLGKPLDATVDPANVSMLGIRSVDPAERDLLSQHGLEVNDISQMDRVGAAHLLKPFLERVRQANGLLHVSLDVDFMDPEIAPGVKTGVAGGATFREAHLIMEMIYESRLLSSLDVVELNPFLDDRGSTARLLVGLVASLFGKRIMPFSVQGNMRA